MTDSTFEAIVRLLRPEMVRAVGSHAGWKCTSFIFSPVTCRGEVYLQAKNNRVIGAAGWCRRHLADEMRIEVEVDG